MPNADNSCDATESNHNHFPTSKHLHDKKQKVVKPPSFVNPKAKSAWEMLTMYKPPSQSDV
jgi:hypothetical protein